MSVKISPTFQKTATVIGLLCIIAAALVFGAPGQGFRSLRLKKKIETLFKGKYPTLKLNAADTTYSVDLRGNVNMSEAVSIRNQLSATLSQDEWDHVHPMLYLNQNRLVSSWNDITTSVTQNIEPTNPQPVKR